MTQEHFLPEIANQAVNQESIRTFFQEYDNIQEQWPWQASVEHWVDYILDFAEKPDIMSVFIDPNLESGGKLYLRVDGCVLPGPDFIVEQYNQLLSVIKTRVICLQAIAGQRHEEGFIVTKAGQRHWIGFLQTVTGVQVTINFGNSVFSTDPFAGWPAQAKYVVEQMQQHPNGLMLFCHRGWSLSQHDAIFKVLNSLIHQSKVNTRCGWITESLQLRVPYENMTQLCVDGSWKAWEQASRALVAQDIDIVLMRGRNEKEVVTQAVLTALEDRMVLVDVSHFNVIDTLLWLLTELPVSPSQVTSILLGVVGDYSHLRQVCPDCAAESKPDDQLLMLLAEPYRSSMAAGKWVQGQGCSTCLGTGYLPRPRLSVVEAVYFDQSLAKLCSSGSSREQLTAALNERGFSTYFEQAFELARQGRTTLKEAMRVGLARRSEL